MAFTTVRIRVRKLNSHKPRSSYVTSILITNLTFPMFFFFFFYILLLCTNTRQDTTHSLFFLLKLSTLFAAIFLFVPLVLSLLCGRSTGVFHYCFLFSIRYQTLISDIDNGLF